MANNFDNSRLTRETQRLFIGNTEVSGIQSISLDFKNNLVPLKSIGMSDVQIYPLSAQNGQVTIDYIPLTNDILLPNVTGEGGLNGYILRSQNETGDFYTFNSGFITSYSSKCAINSLPTISVGMNVLGEIGGKSGINDVINSDLHSITGQTGLGNHYLATFSSIDLTLDQFSYSRLNSYELNIQTNRNPIYAIGNSNPISVGIVYPIEVTMNASIDLNDYNPDSLTSYPCQTRVNNLILSLKDHQSHVEYLRYSFNNLILIGQNYTNNINGNVIMNLQYKTYLGRPTGETLSLLPECISFTGTTGITLCNTCPTGNCIYNSGLMFNCNDAVVIDNSILLSSITNNGITYGTLKFKYDYTNMTCYNDVCVSNFQLIDFFWNYDYIDVYPSVGTVLKPINIIFNCNNTQCHIFPFIVSMEGCDLNFCITLPDKRFCPTTTTSTTTTTTSSTTTTSTTTPIGPTTTTTTTTPTTTTTTTTPTTTTTSTTTTSSTTTTTTTPTTTTTTTTPTTTTTTTTPPPCDGCNGYTSSPISVPHFYGVGGGECGEETISCNLLGACTALTSLTPETSPLCIETPSYNACWLPVINYLTNSCGYSFVIGSCSSADACQVYVSISVV